MVGTTGLSITVDASPTNLHTVNRRLGNSTIGKKEPCHDSPRCTGGGRCRCSFYRAEIGKHRPHVPQGDTQSVRVEVIDAGCRTFTEHLHTLVWSKRCIVTAGKRSKQGCKR